MSHNFYQRFLDAWQSLDAIPNIVIVKREIQPGASEEVISKALQEHPEINLPGLVDFYREVNGVHLEWYIPGENPNVRAFEGMIDIQPIEDLGYGGEYDKDEYISELFGVENPVAFERFDIFGYENETAFNIRQGDEAVSLFIHPSGDDTVLLPVSVLQYVDAAIESRGYGWWPYNLLSTSEDSESRKEFLDFAGKYFPDFNAKLFTPAKNQVS